MAEKLPIKVTLPFIKEILVPYNSTEGEVRVERHGIFITLYVQTELEGLDTKRFVFEFHPLDIMHLMVLTESDMGFSNMIIPKYPFKTQIKNQYCDLGGRLIILIGDDTDCKPGLDKLKEYAKTALLQAKQLKQAVIKQAVDDEKVEIEKWTQFL